MEFGQLHQSRDAGAAPLAEALEAVFHVDAILIQQRHDVGDRAEGCEAHPAEEHLAEPGCDLLGPGGPRGDRPRELEGDAGAAQFAKGIARVWQSRVDEHGSLGERVGERVVIRDDQFKAKFLGEAGLRHARDATVDRDDEAGAVGGERPQRIGVEAVALLESIGHIPRGRRVDRLEASGKDRRGTHPVGVVVAIDHDLSACSRGGKNPIGCLGDPRQQFRITQVGHRAAEKRPHRRSIGQSTGGEQPGHDA